MIWKENYPGSLPLAAVVFGVFFLIATWLLRSGRVMAGAIFTGILCLFEVISFPGWQRHAPDRADLANAAASRKAGPCDQP